MNQAFIQAIAYREQAVKWVMKKFKFSLEQAEDTVTDALLRAHGTPTQPRYVKSWFFTICRNQALNHIRSIVGRHKDRSFVPLDALIGVQLDVRSMEDETFDSEVTSIIERVLRECGPRQAKAFRLRWAGWNFHEIGEEMDCCYNTAKANYRHAMLKVRERLVELNINVVAVECLPDCGEAVAEKVAPLD